MQMTIGELIDELELIDDEKYGNYKLVAKRNLGIDIEGKAVISVFLSPEEDILYLITD